MALIQNIRRSYVTLFELLVVLAIFSLIGGVIGINIKKAIREQRFRSEVSMVVDQLQLAQNLMLILETDVRIKFQSKNDEIEMRMELLDKISKNWANQLTKKPKILKTIQYVGFKDQISEIEEPGQTAVQFLSGGSLMSRGIMQLATSKGVEDYGRLRKFILLTGEPGPIEVVSTEPDVDNLSEVNKIINFNQSLVNYTFQEVMAEEQQANEDKTKK